MAKVTTQPRVLNGKTQYEDTSNVVKLNHRNYKKVELIPRNTAQETYVEELLDKRVVFAVGPAGTGKTLLAVLRAIKSLREGEITKIIITRPAVSVDEKHGFLPGDLNAKMEPWTRPIFDVFEEYYGLPETQALQDAVKELNRGKPMKAVKFLTNWISDYNDTLENAVRLAAYKTAIAQGMSKQTAANIAKNLTVNFSRKGAGSQIAGSLFAFFNASVQGTSRLYQTLRGPMGKKIMFGGFLLSFVE